MYENTYGDLLAKWKVDLIRSRARRLRISDADLQDLTQEIVLKILSDFTYEKEKASEKTALKRLIDNELKMFLRRRTRYEQIIKSAAREETIPSPEDQNQLSLDINNVLRQLSHEERETCISLAEGKTAYEIASQRRCHWSRIQRIIRRVRTIFLENGLQAWVAV